ncbi:PP2C family serine/threonine-protein phosphatase [Nodosilinea nodulosa]|uniref:PP2C family serine/threonine-protein phosphatase n=1 Tax=Nodosilinea nodulosa TaxID=416001 RepID=UPI00036192DC|nr:PP2C family serine/threonine-protein phosphatase [Nodosilinea nodulosa]
MANQFELVGGSVTGREHLRVGKNNQDALGWQVTDGGVVAVVCDGCGSGPHSEVGAKLGTRLLIEALQRGLAQGLPVDHEAFWPSLRATLLGQLGQVAAALGGDRAQTIQDYLLFTIAGAVITPTTTVVFTLGDGVVAINDRVMQLGPFANNAPPYLAYGLLEESTEETTSAALQIKVLQALPTDQVQSLLLGTDGLGDLMAAAEKPLPGRSEYVGDIAQFWQDDRYFRNPDQARRRLTLINRDVTKFDSSTQQWLRQAGLLPDDTTLIVIRRKEASC